MTDADYAYDPQGVYRPLGVHRGPCGLCGHPDARHRLAESIVGRYYAGDDLTEIAEDYELDAHDVRYLTRVVPHILAAAKALTPAQRGALLRWPEFDSVRLRTLTLSAQPVGVLKGYGLVNGDELTAVGVAVRDHVDHRWGKR